MNDILLLVEDDALENTIRPIVRRYLDANGLTKTGLKPRVERGYPNVLAELRRLAGQEIVEFEAVIVGVDANCQGVNSRVLQLDEAASGLACSIVRAVADPHVERWLLLDQQAFRTVLGVGCSAPDQKCEKARYKNLLRNAVSNAGLQPLLGGIEHAEAIASNIDVDRVARNNADFRRFMADLRSVLNELVRTKR